MEGIEDLLGKTARVEYLGLAVVEGTTVQELVLAWLGCLRLEIGLPVWESGCDWDEARS